MRNMRNVVIVSFNFLLLLVFVSAIGRSTGSEISATNGTQPFTYIVKAMEFLWSHSGYQHVWPEMELGWRIIVGTLIGIFGATFGSVGGVGGGGIFVPMLILIIGFDPKSATAISKCMIMGAAISTVFYNLKLKHPTLDRPIIDYDLVLLIQPMILLGISIGVVLSVLFADWMITALLIILFIGTSIKAFFKGVETWKKETIIKKETVKLLESQETVTLLESQETVKLLESTASCSEEEEYKCLPDDGPQKETRKNEGTIIGNIHWKEFGLVCCVWLAHLVLHVAKTYTPSCSLAYWILFLLQIPPSLGVYLYEAVGLYQGWRAIASSEGQITHWKLHHLILALVCGLVAGIIGGLLGIGSGFVMGPLLLEVGIAPQATSATATLGMTFSASISVVQYYLLNRFPVPYALYLTLVATFAAYIGQRIIDKLVSVFQRASLIIFVVAFTIFISTIALGGIGISDMVMKIQRNEYMGFEDLCKYDG
ncbi:sulfite exporter TauE/SafE family protein 3-like isoform X2 [Gastrolobium bilobum]|uniref:sulfite exporter TauE/SafE family protein 3-like isoform X2 n=1 Tax=Gastrolobium bilobum TaxID=150636 RepID=UPI002AB21C5C|nr:sulfite exporter TauE/SafE family protein 3-like isoform X2 [Gastrolobium bilobum]